MYLSKRLAFKCPIFGTPKDFNCNKLPGYEDVIRCCQQERLNLSVECINIKVSFSDVSQTVAGKIKSIYNKASIPSVTEYQMVQLIKAYYDKYTKIKKFYIRDIQKESYTNKIEEFKTKAKLLFDVAACKCTIALECTCSKTPDLCTCTLSIRCSCAKPNKIPPLELRFMFLQRKHGLGRIGGIDSIEKKKNTNRLKRKIPLQSEQTVPSPSTSM